MMLIGILILLLQEKVPLEIDSRAGCNVMSLQTVKRIGAENKVKQSNVSISGIHSHAIKAHGTVELPCTYNNVTHVLKFQVLANTCSNLLGRDCLKLGLIARVHVASCDKSL